MRLRESNESFRVESELHLVAPNRQAGFERFPSEVLRLLENQRFQVTRTSSESSSEEYYDDAAKSLLAVGASIHLTRSEDRTTWEVRLPVSDGEWHAGNLSRRILRSVHDHKKPASPSLGNVTEDKGVAREWFTLITRRIADLNVCVRAESQRVVYDVVTANGGRARLSVGTITYNSIPGRPRSSVELEVIASAVPQERLESLGSLLRSRLPLLPSREGRYGRGVFHRRSCENPVENTTQQVVIDTDCGVDDALALVLALRSSALDVLAVTTVSGNVSEPKVFENVFKVFDALALDTLPQVSRGATRALTPGLPVNAESVHGADGLGDLAGPSSRTRAAKVPASDLICDVAKARPHEVTLIALGPLTNVAHAIHSRPDDVRQLRRIVAMGGVFGCSGNVGPAEEFNIAADPEAARIVLEFCRETCRMTAVDSNGLPLALSRPPTDDELGQIRGFRARTDPISTLPLTFVGLDVTHRVALRRADLELLSVAFPENPLLRFVRGITGKYMDFYFRNEGLAGCYLHDPLAVAYVAYPHLLNVRPRIVISRGSTLVCDDRPTRNIRWRFPGDEVIWVATGVHAASFERLLLESLIPEEPDSWRRPQSSGGAST